MRHKYNRKITEHNSGALGKSRNANSLAQSLARPLAWAAMAIAIGASIVFSGFSPALAVMAPSFFNSTEEMNSDLAPFKKWTSALSKYSKEVAAKKAGPCGGKELNSCSYGKWTSFLDGIKDKDAATKIREVNNSSLLKDFIRFPERLYKGHPYWVPPLFRTLTDIMTVSPG